MSDATEQVVKELRSREDFDRYQEAFHAGDYDTAFDYYVENPKLSIFGVEITTRLQLDRFHRFLHTYIRETVQIERFAVSEDLVAVEAVVRIQGLARLDPQSLREQGMYQFHPIDPGEHQVLRHLIHYRLRDGKIESGTCVNAPL
jgi:hypothetical protein